MTEKKDVLPDFPRDDDDRPLSYKNLLSKNDTEDGSRESMIIYGLRVKERSRRPTSPRNKEREND